MDYVKDPVQIESKSFDIIAKELGDKIHKFSEWELPIVQRVIHTTADFEYADLLEFQEDSIQTGINLLKAGADIYADTGMIMAGINKKKLEKTGSQIYNYVHDEDVWEEARNKGITRSMAGIKKAMKNPNIKIYAIGNAPTALFQIQQLIEEGYDKPELIIAVPVGFVGAKESKEMVKGLDIPYITVNGRKGGSPVAVSIINALQKLI